MTRRRFHGGVALLFMVSMANAATEDDTEFGTGSVEISRFSSGDISLDYTTGMGITGNPPSPPSDDHGRDPGDFHFRPRDPRTPVYVLRKPYPNFSGGFVRDPGQEPDFNPGPRRTDAWKGFDSEDVPRVVQSSPNGPNRNGAPVFWRGTYFVKHIPGAVWRGNYFAQNEHVYRAILINFQVNLANDLRDENKRFSETLNRKKFEGMRFSAEHESLVQKKAQAYSLLAKRLSSRKGYFDEKLIEVNLKNFEEHIKNAIGNAPVPNSIQEIAVANGKMLQNVIELPPVKPIELLSQETTEFGQHARQTLSKFQSSVSKGPQPLWAQWLGINAIKLADKQYSQQQLAEAQFSLNFANAMADICFAGVLPAGWARDVFEAVTGTNFITGQTLTDAERYFAVAGALTLGAISLANKASSAISALSKLASTWKRETFGFTNAISLLRDLKPENRDALSKLAQNLTASLSENRGNLAELKKLRTDRHRIYKSMDLRQMITYKATAQTPKAFRYFGGKSQAVGRFLLKRQYATEKTLREGAAISSSWGGTVENVAEFQFVPGTDIFESRILSQGMFYPGGDSQLFITNPATSLKLLSVKKAFP